ncbi:hypothetical protein [Bradyrhizobium sp. G127]|uniref:hypothetical protein n=1 Tax=Bradyrhizobium sp. G127 TaxID=2904800 RepID=UPI001F42BFF4|nr:hypothetical protein [Bradyrhizobium sp. G127]MCF2523339.1 hypothetical protein [Bradyrhizobium sp. G127]
MLSRALILAAVAFALGWFGVVPADAQNLEAGKPPSQIFSSTCSLCHKSARGLLKSVSPGSLPGFLRQHYTTSTDMAAAMSAYVLSSGAANAPVAGGNLTRQGQEAKSGGAPSEPAAERGRRPSREVARPDADGIQGGTPPGAGAPDGALAARQKAAAERRAARLAAKGKAGLPPKDEARHETPKDAAATTEASKSDSPKADSPKTETARTESPKADGTRPDPVPAVTPAPKEGESRPKEAEKPADVAVALPKAEIPSGPLTIDMGPPPAPKAAFAGPPPTPAGKPEPPISH